MTKQVIDSIRFGVVENIEEGKNQMAAEVSIRINFDYIVADETPESLEEIKKLLTHQVLDNLIMMGDALNKEREYARAANVGSKTRPEENSG